ncbi:MAG: diguanylate cyclase [Sphingomonas bacterium]
MTIFRWICGVLLAFLAFPSLAIAQDGADSVPLATCVARVRAGDSAAAMFRADGRFDCVHDQTALGPGDYWVRSAPFSSHAPLVRTASVWQDAATLYVLYADGAIASRRMDGHEATHAVRLGATFERDIPRREAPAIRLLWHVEGAANLRGIVVGAHLSTWRHSARSDLILGSLYSAFAGLCIALLIYNLALWAALRHNFQLAYCMMVTGLLLYTFSSSGAMAWVFPWLENNDRLRINYAMLSISAASGLAFARSFFERQVFEGWIDRAADLVMIVLLAAPLGVIGLAPWHIGLLDHIYAISFLLLVVFVPVILWAAWRKRSNYLWLFSVCWAAPVMFAGMRVAENLHLVRWNFLLDNSTILAMALEAVLSSMAIAYRFRLIATERDDAQMLADADPLTGLLNRRGFLRAAIGREQPHLLVLADIDHFKSVNEALGHDGGDEVLRIIARALRTAAPPDALIARLGGEEFALLVPGWSEEPELAAEVLSRVRGERMPFDMAVTVSLGTCAGRIADEQDWKRLYRNADQALFAAKTAGRDRVRHSPPVLDPYPACAA